MRTGEKRIQFQTASTTRMEYTLGRTKGFLKLDNAPKWEYTTRCDVKVKVLQDDKGDALRILLGILMETGHPTIAIIPWEEDEEVTSKPIIDIKNLTTIISQLKK